MCIRDGARWCRPLIIVKHMRSLRRGAHVLPSVTCCSRALARAGQVRCGSRVAVHSCFSISRLVVYMVGCINYIAATTPRRDTEYARAHMIDVAKRFVCECALFRQSSAFGRHL